MLSFSLGCHGKLIGKPPACPSWTDAEWLELKTLIESNEYSALVNRVKRNTRYCEAIDKMR